MDKDTEVLFYYAGHGLQFRGENFLVGIDAQLKREATLQFETFKLNTILNLLEKRASTTLLFWDACRDNPLADELLRSIPGSSSGYSPLVRGGAAALPPRRGDTLIVFSAEPGKTALDGSGEFSPFAKSLGRHIGTPNVETKSMLKRVTAEVLEHTHDFQRPERLSQLTALIRSLPEPLHRLGLVLRCVFAAGANNPESILRFCVTLVGRKRREASLSSGCN